MLDLLSFSVELLMTAGPDPREERPGCQGRAQRARRAWPCGPAALGYKGQTHGQRPETKGETVGQDPGDPRRRDLGLLGGGPELRSTREPVQAGSERAPW